GKVVLTDRPTFSWQPLEGATAYEIKLFDISAGLENARPLPEFSTAGLTRTSWTPSHLLPRNRRLAWELTARNADKELARAEPQHFQVLALDKSRELERLRAKNEAQELRLGIDEAQAGLLDAAEQRFKQVLSEDPSSTAARNLLLQVRALRPSRE